jgi:type III secretion system YscQ/HrcQ family protein
MHARPAGPDPAQDLALWNAAMRCQDRPIALGDGGLSVMLHGVAGPGGEDGWHKAGPDLSLRLELCDLTALAGAGPDAAVTLAHVAALPADLAAALTTAAIQTLAGLLNLPLPLVRGRCPDPMPPQALHVTLQRDGGVLARLLVCGGPAAMAALLRALGPLPGLPPAEIAAAVTCPWEALGGGLTLRRAALEGLRPGDALLHGPQPHLCRIRAGGRVIDASKDETGWKIEALMPDETPDAPQDAPPIASPGEIPVRLDFRIARGQMTLAQLGELAPGGMLALDLAPPAPGCAVEILANGSKIGDGHLIMIDDRPAVRISRLFGAALDD